MVWPDYKIHNYCRECNITMPKEITKCKHCKLMVRTKPRGKKKESMVKRIE